MFRKLPCEIFGCGNNIEDNNSPLLTIWTLEQYIEKRLDAQQKYHSGKATKTNNTFNRYRAVEIILAACIPVLITLTGKLPILEYFAISFSIIVAVVAGLLVLGNFQSDWTYHRITSEKLKAEKAMFLSRILPYDKADISDNELLKILAQNVEAILTDETQRWYKRQQQQPRTVKKVGEQNG